MYMCTEKIENAYLQDVLKRQQTGEKMTVLEEIVASMATKQIETES